jgi:hypothetical protein
MEFSETLGGLAVGLVALGLALWQDRRPWRPGKFNWVPLMIVGLVATIVFGIHLGALLLE